MSELLIFLLMIVIFAGSCFFLKLPVGIALLLSSVGGALAGGFGVPVKFMVEGTMSFLDTILVIACAMIFMKCIQYSGALDMLNRFFLRRFHNHKVILLLLLMLIIMFPGMITGSSTAAVISAGAIVCPILIAMGIPAEKAAAIIAWRYVWCHSSSGQYCSYDHWWRCRHPLYGFWNSTAASLCPTGNFFGAGPWAKGL